MPPDTRSTITRLYVDRASRSPGATAMHFPTVSGWSSRTWGEAEARTARHSAALAALGIGRGDRVAILGNPHPHWMEADFATLCLGAVTVGIYPTLLPDAIRYQLENAGVRVLLVEPALLPRVEGAAPPGVTVLPWDHADSAPDPDIVAFRERALTVESTDLCSLIYTSGTTGNPKGSKITHGAMYAVCVASQKALPLQPGDRSIVYLPLAHSLQRMSTYRSLLEDLVGYWCPAVDQLQATIPIARPHVLVAVPRVLERMKSSIEAAVAGQSPTVQRLFAWALGLGIERSRLVEGRAPVPAWLAMRYAVADRLVLGKVRGRLGGSLRILAVGGAALNPEVGRFFHALGFSVIEGWGLTETCAPATQNGVEVFRFGTVGRAIDGVDLKIEADGEVLVKGPGLFTGYWDDPKATSEAFTDDGYFRTGDIGTLDADGFLRIVDRKKEILITAGGKNIPPVNIEKKLEGGMVGQAVMVGDGRPYLIALLAPDPDHPGSAEEREAFGRKRVAEANASLASFEQVKKFAWVPEPLTMESGLLTPSLKLKRKAILARYADIIDALYRS